MPATTRSSAYLTANCRPFGSIGRISSSGRPPRCSTDTRSTETSNRRGTSEADTPSSRQRRTMLSITAWGAVEKVKTTCSTSCSSITRSRSQLAPTTGRSTAAPSSSSGSLSRKPTGRSPNAGRSIRRFATSWPTRPAPTISVGRPPSPRAMARARAMKRPVRPGRQRNRGDDPGLRGLRGGVRVVLHHDAHARSPPSSRRRSSTRSSGARRAGASAGGCCTSRGCRTARAPSTPKKTSQRTGIAGSAARWEIGLRRATGDEEHQEIDEQGADLAAACLPAGPQRAHRGSAQQP